MLAEASQIAIRKVSEAIEDKEMPVMYLLGEKYIEAVNGISNSENAKIVLLPADIPGAVRGLIGALGK